jgi:hypothetical protein
MAKITLLQITINDVTYATDVTTMTREQIVEELAVLVPELTALQNLKLESDDQLREKYQKLLETALIDAKNQRRIHAELLEEKEERLTLLTALKEQIDKARKENGMQDAAPEKPVQEDLQEDLNENTPSN